MLSHCTVIMRVVIIKKRERHSSPSSCNFVQREFCVEGKIESPNFEETYLTFPKIDRSILKAQAAKSEIYGASAFVCNS